MMIHPLRGVLAVAIAGAFVLAAMDAATAQRKRPAYKNPRPPAYVVRPYVRDPNCVVTYDSAGFALPPEYSPTCESAFRRIYPPRR